MTTPAHLVLPGQAARWLIDQADTAGAADQDLDDHLAEYLSRLDVDLQAEYLWMMDGQIQSILAEIARARQAVTRALLADIKARGDIRLGDAGYRIAPNRERRMVDRDRLLEWVRQVGGPDAVEEVWRLNDDNVRITAVRAIAERHLREHAALTSPEGITDDEVAAYIDAVEDTFFVWVDVDGGEKLDTIPATKAVWVSKLSHGERRPR